MALISHVRGALLEEAVLFLLQKVGYQTIDSELLGAHPRAGFRVGGAGVEVQGRGTWHQIDALALCTHSPAFLYPLHLLVEAKFYERQRVRIEVVRNAVGVIKDISENHFSDRRVGATFSAPRYNYSAVVVSPTGFSKGAAEYALAHQIFLLEYANLPVIQPLLDAIGAFTAQDVDLDAPGCVRAVRAYVKALLKGDEPVVEDAHALNPSGVRALRESVALSVRRIGGSYFGMLQGRWPLHLLRERELPPQAFSSDTVQCRVQGNERGEWSFTPIDIRRHEAGWFELEFNLPPAVAELVSEQWDDSVEVANYKQEYFSHIDLTGIIGGVRRSVRLQLDANWIRQYVDRVRQNI